MPLERRIHPRAFATRLTVCRRSVEDAAPPLASPSAAEEASGPVCPRAARGGSSAPVRRMSQGRRIHPAPLRAPRGERWKPLREPLRRLPQRAVAALRTASGPQKRRRFRPSVINDDRTGFLPIPLVEIPSSSSSSTPVVCRPRWIALPHLGMAALPTRGSFHQCLVSRCCLVHIPSHYLA